IKRFPDSERATQARHRLTQLSEDRDWERPSKADTATAYRQVLTQHPNGKGDSAARSRLESFKVASASETGASKSVGVGQREYEPTPAWPGGFGVQLGAFSTEAAAHLQWERLQSRFARELQGLHPEVVAGKTASGTVYRLQAPVGSEPEARALCSALQKQSQPCVVVLPPD